MIVRFFPKNNIGEYTPKQINAQLSEEFVYYSLCIVYEEFSTFLIITRFVFSGIYYNDCY